MLEQVMQTATRVTSFTAPPKILFGVGSVAAHLASEVTAYAAKKVLIVADPGLIQAGAAEKVEATLKGRVDKVGVYSDVVPEPTVDLPMKAAELINNEGYQLVIGFGGGSAMDVAKAGAMLAVNGGHTRDYFGLGKVAKPGLPTILIPSTAGTGSEVTSVAVFDDPENSAKMGIQSPYLAANLAIVDPGMTVSCPQGVTAASGIDALIHAIEAYTSRDATPFSDALALPAIQLVGKYLEQAYADGENIEARTGMSLASLWAGLAFAQAGVAAVHACAYPLGSTYHIPHGLSNSLMLAPVMRFNLISNYRRFSTIAETLGEVVAGMPLREAAEKSVDAVCKLSAAVGIPACLRDVGVKENTLEKMGKDTMAQTRLLAHNPRKITEKDLIGFFKEAF